MQRALIHFHKPENRRLVKAALARAGRSDLIPILAPEKHRKGRKG